MKKLLSGICIASLLGLTDMHAQHENMLWKNDPTYSVNNYKHPNKAAAAKKIQQTQPRLISINEPVSGSTHTTKVMIPARKIVASEKVGKSKIKTPLAVRRRASERLAQETVHPVNNEQLDD